MVALLLLLLPLPLPVPLAPSMRLLVKLFVSTGRVVLSLS